MLKTEISGVGLRPRLTPQTRGMKMTVYSNPRMSAIIENWPSGGKHVTAKFSIEIREGKGERAVRFTTGAGKVLTFARKARIVDGDDGRTYIVGLCEQHI